MWDEMERLFRSSPRRMDVASRLLMLGLSCNDDLRIFCEDIEVPVKKMADTMGVDRRVVTATIEDLMGNATLRPVFLSLRPRAFLRDAAKAIDWGVVEVEASPETVGIVAAISSIIAEYGLSIRQVVADDPNLYPAPKLTIITGERIPPELLELFLGVKGVKKISIY